MALGNILTGVGESLGSLATAKPVGEAISREREGQEQDRLLQSQLKVAQLDDLFLRHNPQIADQYESNRREKFIKDYLTGVDPKVVQHYRIEGKLPAWYGKDEAAEPNPMDADAILKRTKEADEVLHLKPGSVERSMYIWRHPLKDPSNTPKETEKEKERAHRLGQIDEMKKTFNFSPAAAAAFREDGLESALRVQKEERSIAAKKVKKLSAAQQGQLDSLNASLGLVDEEVQPAISALMDKLGGPEKAAKFWTQVKTSAIGTWQQWLYANHIDPTSPEYSKLVKSMALLKVLQTGGLLKGVRNQIFISEIWKHIPNPNDSAPLMQSKLDTIRANMIRLKRAVLQGGLSDMKVMFNDTHPSKTKPPTALLQHLKPGEYVEDGAGNRWDSSGKLVDEADDAAVKAMTESDAE